MASSKLIKWSLAVSAAAMVSVAVVPAMAAHASHKLSGATTRPSQNLAAVNSTGKAHRLAVVHHKAKTLASPSAKHAVKHHHRAAITPATTHKHSAKSLDKGKKSVSNM
jgi:hypothetical protein